MKFLNINDWRTKMDLTSGIIVGIIAGALAYKIITEILAKKTRPPSEGGDSGKKSTTNKRNY